MKRGSKTPDFGAELVIVIRNWYLEFACGIYLELGMREFLDPPSLKQ
jgi:hypothetical protein